MAGAKFYDGGAGEGENIILGGGDVTLTQQSRAIFVGGGGVLDVMFSDGSNVQFTSAVAGSVLPIRVTKIFDTATTATSLVALF